MEFTRRSMLALPIVPFALAGCARLEGMLPSDKIKVVARDVALIADALHNVLPALAQVPGIEADKIAKIGVYIGDLKALAERIRDVNTESSAQPLVEQVVRNVQGIVGIMSTFESVPQDIRNVLTAASVLLPVIQLAVNLAITAKADYRMSEDVAREILRKK